MPITWYNVNAPSLADASRPLDAAGNSLKDGFAALNQVLKQPEATAQANWDQTKTNNTNAALNQIMGYANPEAYAAAQKAGAIQSLLSSAGAQIDANAVRQAADQRMSVLQDRAAKDINYNNMVVDERTNPIREQALAAQLRGDTAAYKALTEQFQIAGGRNLDKLLQAGQDIGEHKIVWDEGRKRFTMDQSKTEAEIARTRSAISTDAAQRGLLNAQVGLVGAQANEIRGRTAIEAANAEMKARELNAASQGSYTPGSDVWKTWMSTGPYDKGSYGEAGGQENLIKALKDQGLEPKQIEDITQQIGKYYSKGVPIAHDPITGKPTQYAPLPISTILSAVGAASDMVNWIPGATRKGDNTVNKLDEIFGVNPNHTKDSTTYGQRDANLIDKIGAYNAIISKNTAGMLSPSLALTPEQVAARAGKSELVDQLKARREQALKNILGSLDGSPVTLGSSPVTMVPNPFYIEPKK